MTRTLTEEYLLLALDDDRGRPVLDSQRLHAALAGAVVTQLVLDGVLEIAETDGEVSAGRLRSTGAAGPADELMAEIVERAHGRKPKDAVSRIGGASAWRNRAGSLKEHLLEQLAADGVVASERARVLGLFPTTTWKPVDGAVEREIRHRVLAVLRGGREADARTGALIALLSASGIVAKVFPEEDRRMVTSRAEEISRQSWAGEAVRKSIQEIRGAMTAVVVSTVVVSGSGS